MNQVEQYVPGFDDFAAQLRHNRLPDTDRLRGRIFTLGFPGCSGQVSFAEHGSVHWQGLPLEPALAEGSAPAKVVQACVELYFIDLALPPSSRQSAVLILDLRLGHGVLLHAWLDTGRKAQGQASNFAQALHLATLDGAAGEALPQATDELIGKRVLNIYSQQTAVEHVYLNSRWYAYHIHGGVRHGDCDCDEASYFKLRDQLYLVTFREKAVDVAIIFVLDTQAWRNTGIAIGEVDAASGWFSVPIGARVQLLSETRYPQGFIPL
ncbi:MoaF C-terminal domain-containing protein [Pseudomonas sp. Fl4BN1]|uniref:MoaF C-terminal domain-containing protein n=1 Tax=Pseudomonas sp. Fl4BN1 TaxID=2697651 RepID=UPI001378A288|nr:MoaF C-terminal domain-containing protein [Pseudomonas sp. Fl4BN1]NBF09177.1 hypothetical protein [Pseudomonas sp. Fl4BN1]